MVGAWGHPTDPTIYARVELPSQNMTAFLNTYNKTHNSQVSMVHAVAKIMALCFQKYPQYNVAIARNAFFRRKQTEIFLPAVLRKAGHHDLSGVKVCNLEEKPLTDITKEVNAKTKALRLGNDKPINRIIKLLSWFPTWLCRYIIKLIDFLQYTLNISPSIIGLPQDRFGTVIISAVGAFGLEEAYIPLFPFARTPYSMGVGKPQLKPIVKDGAVVAEHVVTITFTADHRVVDGAQGAQMIRLFKKMFLNPEFYLGAH